MYLECVGGVTKQLKFYIMMFFLPGLASKIKWAPFLIADKNAAVLIAISCSPASLKCVLVASFIFGRSTGCKCLHRDLKINLDELKPRIMLNG